MRITHMLCYFMACIRGKNKPRLQSTPFLATEFVKFCCEKTNLLKLVSVFCQLISHNLSLVYWNQNKLCIRSCCFALASAWPSQQRDQHVVGTVGGAVASGHTGPFYSSFIDFHILCTLLSGVCRLTGWHAKTTQTSKQNINVVPFMVHKMMTSAVT